MYLTSRIMYVQHSMEDICISMVSQEVLVLVILLYLIFNISFGQYSLVFTQRKLLQNND